MLVGQRISQVPPHRFQNYIAGIRAPLEWICHCDRHGLFTRSVLILNFAMKPPSGLPVKKVTPATKIAPVKAASKHAVAKAPAKKTAKQAVTKPSTKGAKK